MVAVLVLFLVAGCATIGKQGEVSAPAAEEPVEEPSTPPGGYVVEKPALAMPFKMEDFKFQEMGIWPFCVHGGDHPEGHGGIDFELVPTAEITASTDGVVEMIETIEEEPHHWRWGVFITHGSVMTGYGGLLNLRVGLGDHVKKGQVLGTPCRTDDGTYYFHYEVGDLEKEQRVCALDYIDTDFRSALDELFKKARYPEQQKEPGICNCGGIPMVGN